MIHYQLKCRQNHDFDGWFKDSASFETLAGRGMVECPTCGDTQVCRALMAPALAIRAEQPSPPPGPATSPAPPPAVAGGGMPDHVRAMLQRLRSEVEKHCDYVGPQFAEEARKIHRGESARRGIYGETTGVEAESLAEEGIEVARIPWVQRAES